MEGKELRVLLIEDNPGDARLVQEMLAEVRGRKFRIQCADSLMQALNTLAQSEFDVALMDLSLPDSQGTQTFTAIHSHTPDLPVVVLTGLDSEEMARDTVRVGVQDYLVKGKLTSDILVRALEYAVIRQKSSEKSGGEAKKARVMGMLASKGGVGTTTLATTFALELKRQADEKVLFMELNPATSTAGFLFKILAPPYTVLDVISNLHRLDARLWKGMVQSLPAGIDYLPSPGATRYGQQLNSERVRHILRFARSLYTWIIVDMGQLDALSASLLEDIRELAVVTTHELPALYETQKLLKQLVDGGLEREQLHLMLSRTSKSSSSFVSYLEKALGYPIYGVVTDHSDELFDAYAEGRMLDEKLGIRKDIAKVVARTLGPSQKVAAPSAGLGRFLFTRAEAR